MKRTPMHKTVEDIAQAAGCLDKFQDAIARGREFYLKAEVAGYMPLVIEVLGCTKEVSVAHYGRQNGDAMRDPEYVFETVNWKPVEVTMDYTGFYCRAPKGYRIAGAVDFCRIWARNIREQGFTDPKKASYTTD